MAFTNNTCKSYFFVPFLDLFLLRNFNIMLEKELGYIYNKIAKWDNSVYSILNL